MKCHDPGANLHPEKENQDQGLNLVHHLEIDHLQVVIGKRRVHVVNPGPSPIVAPHLEIVTVVTLDHRSQGGEDTSVIEMNHQRINA